MRTVNRDSIYALALAKAAEIKAELKLLRRWSSSPLPAEKFKNMGAFGCNTMAFEEWIQFILIERIKTIVADRDEFPGGSMLGPYAIRVFDGDIEASRLHNLLYELDEIVNDAPPEKGNNSTGEVYVNSPVETVAIGDTAIPAVLGKLAAVLHQFNGEDLESQLQTFDEFLDFLSPSVRGRISELLINAANIHLNQVSKARILSAAMSISTGGRAAAPYDHTIQMRKNMNGATNEPS